MLTLEALSTLPEFFLPFIIATGITFLLDQIINIPQYYGMAHDIGYQIGRIMGTIDNAVFGTLHNVIPVFDGLMHVEHLFTDLQIGSIAGYAENTFTW